MKTAHDKAEDAVELWVTGNMKSSLSQIICRALKEQDRDTRHACAEALLKLKRYGGSDESMIILHEAETACMNVKAV